MRQGGDTHNQSLGRKMDTFSSSQHRISLDTVKNNPNDTYPNLRLGLPISPIGIL